MGFMMQHPSPHPTAPEATAPTADAPAAAVASSRAGPAWAQKVEDLLVAAAGLCVEHDVDPESFMQAAWAACLDSRPGLREQIADNQLMAQVENLRTRGLVGAA
jgi:hypothetical protein